jgi:hypothetical protein
MSQSCSGGGGHVEKGSDEYDLIAINCVSN